MKIPVSWTVTALGLIAATTSVLGFVGEVNPAGQIRHWALNPPDARVAATAVNRGTRAIIYRLDAAGYSRTNTAAELNAIRTAFDQWQAVAGTVLRFEEGPSATGTKDINSLDGFNTLFWSTNLFVNGGHDNLSGLLALTFVASYPDGNIIADADTVFNGSQYRWFTDPTDPTMQAVFVEAIALHEIGHFLGLRHSPVGGATMLAAGSFGVNSQVGLSGDEWSAARALYPRATGAGMPSRIFGTILDRGTPVFGAAVFAEDAQGNLIAGTVTRSNGVYELPGLEAGPYSVRGAPLDPASSANYLVRGADIAATYRAANTSFLPTTNRDLALAAGGSVSVNFEVTAGEPLQIVRILRPSADLLTPSFTDKPAAIQPTGQTLYLGVLTPGVLGNGVQLSITGDGLSPGPVEWRPNVLGTLSMAAVPVTIDPQSTPGLRSFRLQMGSSVAWAHGFLEVLPPFPDVNFDGLDDRFQRQYWARFTSAEAGPSADPDGDGFDNAWEQRTGSVPTNRLSAHFEIESVRLTAGGAQVQSQTAPGKRFQLWTRDTVPGSAWTMVGPSILATGATTQFEDRTATNRIRFYQVQLLP